MSENKDLGNQIGYDGNQKGQILFIDKENLIRGEMIEEASLLASLLIDHGNIKRVGVAGSLAKGKENPSDIDLVVFIDNKNAKDCQREKWELLKKQKKVKLEKYLTMNDVDWNIFTGFYQNAKYPVDLTIASNDPDEEYIKMMADENIDPNFLENISNDIFLYDPSVNGFKKESVFNEQQKTMMKQASYERIKEVLSNPDHSFYDSIEKSHVHEKRMEYLNFKNDDLKNKSEKDKLNETEKLGKYKKLIESFDKNVFSQEKWDEVVDLAKSELGFEKDSSSVSPYRVDDLSTGTDFYSDIFLHDLVIVGERLRSAETREDRYKILMEKEPTYHRLWYDIILGHVNDKMFQPVVDELELLSRWDFNYQKVLDIGCGTGNSLKMIAPFCSTCVGLDNLDFVLDVAKNNNLPENVTALVKGNATDLPFKKNDFDLIVSNGLTCYLTTQEVKKYVSEVSRVLKPSGVYIETVANIRDGKVLSGFEEEYLSSAKSVLVCFLDRLCSNDKDIKKTENTVTVLLREFKKVGFDVKFSGFEDNDVGVLEFYKK